MIRLSARILFLSLLWASSALAQRELVTAADPVYRFLLRQELGGTIRGFSWGMLPLSRCEVAVFLDSLAHAETLSGTDRLLLHDFRTQFSFDLTHSLENSAPFLPGTDFSGIFDDHRQKYLYAYADSVTSVFFEGFGSYSYRAGKGDSVGSAFAVLGDVGFRLRGTLHDHLGFFLEASNGKLFSGSHDFALLDPRLRANKKFNTDEKSFYDFTKGYLRYDADWIAVTVGREQVLWGMGYSDRLMFGDNTVPFDYAKIDIRSGSLHYSFLHGSLVGADTNRHTLSSKYIAAHRVEFNIGSRVRLGLGEAIVYANQPPLFALMNPLAFMTSAELSTEIVTKESGDNAHNSLIWIDAEVTPVKNVRLSGSWLIDDISFSALGKSDLSGNTNKFSWQAGVLWNDAFTLDNLLVDAEYTRAGPFVGSHRTIVSAFSHWDLPLGGAVEPNSDEWLFGAEYDLTHRLSVSGRIRFQRAGENILDPLGKILFNAGSDILHGEGDLDRPNIFLAGRRVNRTLASLQVTWQPLWQYFLDLNCQYRSFHYPAEGQKSTDAITWMTVRVEY